MLCWTLLCLPGCRTLMDRASTPVQRSVTLWPWTPSDTQPDSHQSGGWGAVVSSYSMFHVTTVWLMYVFSKLRLNIAKYSSCMWLLNNPLRLVSLFSCTSHRKQTACTTCSWTSSHGWGSCCHWFAYLSASSPFASSVGCRVTATPSIRTSASASSSPSHCSWSGSTGPISR